MEQNLRFKHIPIAPYLGSSLYQLPREVRKDQDRGVIPRSLGISRQRWKLSLLITDRSPPFDPRLEPLVIRMPGAPSGHPPPPQRGPQPPPPVPLVLACVLLAVPTRLCQHVCTDTSAPTRQRDFRGTSWCTRRTPWRWRRRRGRTAQGST